MIPRVFLLMTFLLLMTFTVLSQSQYFNLPGAFFYALNSTNQVVDVTAQGNQAVGLTNAESSQTQFGLLTSFDPTTGDQFDNKIVGFGPAHVKMAETSLGTRVVVLTTEGGPNTITIYDLSSAGILTQRARTRLTESDVDYRSNLVLSAQSRVGFVLVSNLSFTREVVAFSLDDGAVLGRLTVGFTAESLEMKEDAGNGTRTLALFRGVFPTTSLVIVNATNPSQMSETGSIPMPNDPVPAGAPNGGVAFSSNSPFMFVIDPLGTFSVVDLNSRSIVSNLDGNFLERIRIFESPSKRYLAVARLTPDSINDPPSLVLIDATNPLAPTAVNDTPLPSFRKADFTFSQSGKLLALASETGFKALTIPSFETALEVPKPDPQEDLAHQIKTFGNPERALGAWGIFTGLFGSFELPAEEAPFDLCIGNGGCTNLRINSETGEYQFTGDNGITLTGTGTLRTKGCTITLTHNASDRRIQAMINTCQNRGTATVQILSPRRTFNLVDQNITDGCGCN